MTVPCPNRRRSRRPTGSPKRSPRQSCRSTSWDSDRARRGRAIRSDPPYKLPFFDDLLAHPLDTYEFTRTLGNAVEDLLTPGEVDGGAGEGQARVAVFACGESRDGSADRRHPRIRDGPHFLDPRGGGRRMGTQPGPRMGAPRVRIARPRNRSAAQDEPRLEVPRDLGRRGGAARTAASVRRGRTQGDRSWTAPHDHRRTRGGMEPTADVRGEHPGWGRSRDGVGGPRRQGRFDVARARGVARDVRPAAGSS